MKISEIISENGSANPFVGLVTNLDLTIKNVDVADDSAPAIFISSLESQLSVLKRIIDSASAWIIPESKLKQQFHVALPLVKQHVRAAATLIALGKVHQARVELLTARKIAVERSHLTFYPMS